MTYKTVTCHAERSEASLRRGYSANLALPAMKGTSGLNALRKRGYDLPSISASNAAKLPRTMLVLG
ncbi:MAG: hypothetical protein H6656_06495 [Ardenticatenaceae bacterium]|nr:hypothetical protein [Ardenticatenaceae bacterium]